ncbi:MAG: CotH kinase family protein [Bacillota bacterium]|nr:CotH kinase family protein [Bacillota bacterium]
MNAVTTYADDETGSEAVLCVNEVCADADENDALHKPNTVGGGYYDWVEIFNPMDVPVNASAFYLTDTLKDKNDIIGKQKYQLPDYEIQPHGFLIIYCGDVPETLAEGEYIADFGISKKGKDTVYITDGENVVDSMAIPAATTNMTYSRYPDGGDKITQTEATPGFENTYTLDAPVFSRPSGFYEPFELEITSDQDDVTIHYTTNGKTPTAQSPEYKGPISMVDVSKNKNVYSARKDVSTLMHMDLLKKYKRTGWYQKPPTKKVDKMNRVKAVAVGPDGKVSEVVYGTYFIGLKDKDRYQDIPVISLQAKDSDLFSYDKGIYVMGKAFDKYKKNVLSKKNAATARRPQFWTCNYHSKTSIPATVEVFENTDAQPTIHDVTMKLKGHIGRAYPQKSWNIKGATFSNTLEAGGSDTLYKLKDTTCSALAQNLNVTVSDQNICQVFLNGEYWGVYYIGDRLSSKQYYADKYDVAKDSVAVIKEGKLNEGVKKDLSDYKAVRKYAQSHDMRIDRNFDHFSDRVDIESLIDYYCAQIFAVNIDWRPNKNYAVWRSNDLESEYVQENGSKWRFILYDQNVGATYMKSGRNMMKYTFNKDKMFKSLYKNADFRKQFNNRFKELLASDFSAENSQAALDSIYNKGRTYMKGNMDRYYAGKKTISDYDSRYKAMRKFLGKRQAEAEKHLNSANSSKKYNGKSLAKFKVSAKDCDYDGTAKTPAVTVKTAAGTKLDQGRDFDVEYSNNIEPGKAKVVVKMKGGFRGTLKTTFKIKK